jgi:hypothetical protein
MGDQHCVIQVFAKRMIDGLKIRAMSVRGELHAVRQPELEVAQKHHASAAAAVAYPPRNHQLAIGIKRGPGPSVARAIYRLFASRQAYAF